jgi:hypothetical protein
MTRQEWRDLQRSLHPQDLVTVQRFAEKLLLDHPFVFATDGRFSLSYDGPGVMPFARRVIAAIGADAERNQAEDAASGTVQ